MAYLCSLSKEHLYLRECVAMIDGIVEWVCSKVLKYEAWENTHNNEIYDLFGMYVHEKEKEYNTNSSIDLLHLCRER